MTYEEFEKEQKRLMDEASTLLKDFNIYEFNKKIDELDKWVSLYLKEKAMYGK